MELFSWYLRYLTAICEGSLNVEGLTAEGNDETEKAMNLQQKIAEIGLPEFVRRCAEAEGTEIPQSVFDEFDPEALKQQIQQTLSSDAEDEESEKQNAYEAFLDYLSLEDALLEYLIDVLKRDDGLAFFRLSQVTVRRELRLHDFLYWLGTKELYAEAPERACATILDACMDRLAKEGQLELIAALLSGDRRTFELFRAEAPELRQVPDATYEWFEEYYLNRYYPYRTILKLRGVQFPEFDFEKISPAQSCTVPENNVE